MSMGKRLFSLIIVITIVGCDKSAHEPQNIKEETEVNTLEILEWTGFEIPEFREQFTVNHPEIEVKFSFFGEDAEAFSKMQTGYRTDVIHPCSGWWQLYVENNLVQPLDVSRLEYFDNMPSALTDLGKFDGQQYFIPWDWGYESILVRTDKVETIPTAWKDLWNPEYAGHVAIYDSGEAQHIVGALVLGYEPFHTTSQEDEAITNKLIELKPNLLTYWTDYTEVVQLIASGDIWLAGSAWTDSYMLLLEQGIPVKYITPEEGRIGFVCGYGISVNARSVDLAYDYINALTSTKASALLIDEYAYGAANLAALEMANQATIDQLELGDPKILEQTVFYESISAERRESLVSNWDRVKVGP